MCGIVEKSGGGDEMSMLLVEVVGGGSQVGCGSAVPTVGWIQGNGMVVVNNRIAGVHFYLCLVAGCRVGGEYNSACEQGHTCQKHCAALPHWTPSAVL